MRKAADALRALPTPPPGRPTSRLHQLGCISSAAQLPGAFPASRPRSAAVPCSRLAIEAPGAGFWAGSGRKRSRWLTGFPAGSRSCLRCDELSGSGCGLVPPVALAATLPLPPWPLHRAQGASRCRCVLQDSSRCLRLPPPLPPPPALAADHQTRSCPLLALLQVADETRGEFAKGMAEAMKRKLERKAGKAEFEARLEAAAAAAAGAKGVSRGGRRLRAHCAALCQPALGRAAGVSHAMLPCGVQTHRADQARPARPLLPSAALPAAPRASAARRCRMTAASTRRRRGARRRTGRRRRSGARRSARTRSGGTRRRSGGTARVRRGWLRGNLGRCGLAGGAMLTQLACACLAAFPCRLEQQLQQQQQQRFQQQQRQRL